MTEFWIPVDQRAQACRSSLGFGIDNFLSTTHPKLCKHNYAHLFTELTEIKSFLRWADLEIKRPKPGVNSVGCVQPYLGLHCRPRLDAPATRMSDLVRNIMGLNKHAVLYASRKLIPRKENYSAGEKEALAVIWAVRTFHIYLYGQHFILDSDRRFLK